MIHEKASENRCRSIEMNVDTPFHVFPFLSRICFQGNHAAPQQFLIAIKTHFQMNFESAFDKFTWKIHEKSLALSIYLKAFSLVWQFLGNLIISQS